MKLRLVAVAAAAMVLVACGERVRTNNPQAYQQSISAIMESLTAEQRDVFVDSMTAIAFETWDVSGDGGAMFGRDPSTIMYFAGAGEKVKGKTADEIIRMGYETRMAKLDEEIQSGMATLASARTERERHRATFDNIRIENPRFYVRRNYIDEPIIDFRLTNNTDRAIREAYFHGELTTDGRSIPWVSEAFNTELSGGLEPGESRHLQLAPNMFGEWGQGDHTTRNDLKLAVTLVNVRGADGQMLLNGQPDDPRELEREVATLQQERTRIQAEYDRL